MPKIKRALLSVFDKSGIVEFAKSLNELNIDIIATVGTSKVLQEHNVPHRKVAGVTGFKEMLGGRVKTLHPKILGGLLALRDDPGQMEEVRKEGIELIDLLVINLYPFEEVIKKKGVKLGEALENIDIGGPALIRAAAKNYPYVAVLTHPSQYESVLAEIRQGEISEQTCHRLAIEAFRLTSRYDEVIAVYLEKQKEVAFPEYLHLDFQKAQDLRYGENPHQRAALYRDMRSPKPGITDWEQLHGKGLSFNNICDLDAAVNLLQEFDPPCAVIIKHNNPCGVAIGHDVLSAYRAARATDPVSAFGGIVGFNQPVDVPTAQELIQMFLEMVVAPSFDERALEILKTKRNLRIMEYKDGFSPDGYDFKMVSGGLLLQDKDLRSFDDVDYRVVTKRAPTLEELAALRFAWKVVKWVKSNAVVFTKEDRTIGIGAGQMSRIDAVELAIFKAKKSALSLEGTVLASDAFFPFRDGIDVAAEAGATAVIQPGGSIRDKEVIEAADEHDMAMIFTGVRHFRH